MVKNNIKKITRSEKNRIIAGVCSGIGNYFEVDPSLVRISFILLLFFGGFSIFLYIACWIILPSESDRNTEFSDTAKANVNEIKEKINSTFKEYSKERKNNFPIKNIFALMIIIFGGLILMQNFGIFSNINIFKLWPIFLIFLGVSLIASK